MKSTIKARAQGVALGFMLAGVAVMNIPGGGAGFAQQPAANSLARDIQLKVDLTTPHADITLASLSVMPSYKPADPFSPVPSRLASAPDQPAARALDPPTVEHKGVSKKFIALGVLGVLTAVGGAVALNEANHNSNCAKTANTQQVCSDVHTAGEIMVPVGAGVAALGFVLGLRHAR